MEDLVCFVENPSLCARMADVNSRLGPQEGFGPPQARVSSSPDLIAASTPRRVAEWQHECAQWHPPADGEREAQAFEL